MSNKKITELVEVTSISNTDLIPIVNDGFTKKATIDDLVNYIGNGFNGITVDGRLAGLSAVFTSSVSALSFYGDGSHLTGVYRPPDNATFVSSVSAPSLSGTFYGDGSNLSGVYRPPDNATFVSSVSAPSVFGTHYGDGSKLSGVLSLTGGTVNGNLTITGNITAAGTITLNERIISTTYLSGNLLEAVSIVPIVSNTLTIDVQKSCMMYVKLSANITNMNFTNSPAAGIVCAFTMQMESDGTERSVYWPTRTRWAGGGYPVRTVENGKVDTFSFITRDGGTTWFAYINGINQ